jgi:hypothetical protein
VVGTEGNDGEAGKDNLLEGVRDFGIGECTVGGHVKGASIVMADNLLQIS